MKSRDQYMVKLKVSDSMGINRRSEMICSGIPFHKGVLNAKEGVHIKDSDGIKIPTQTKVLATWGDGSVRWLLVQFPADCEANSYRYYYLAKGEGKLPDHTIIINDEEDQININTGAIEAAIPKKTLAMMGDVKVRGKNISSSTPIIFVMEDGCTFDSFQYCPGMVTVEEYGTLRATIRLVGWIDDAYKLDTRLRFYAGQSYIQADNTFICLGQPSLHRIREISVNMSASLGNSFIMPGDTSYNIGSMQDGESALLSVDSNMVCKAGMKGCQIQSEKPLDGWGILYGNAGSLGVAVRDFCHLCPKAIEISPDNIKIALWSNIDGDILNLGRTRAKTHHLLYDFGASEPDCDRVRAFQQPLIAMADPEYFCSTDVLGALSPVEASLYDEKIARSFDVLNTQRATMPRENGMLHYGDYYHGGYGNNLTRGDLEYDTAHACFLLYARSGDRKYFDFAVASNQHFIDLDINQETGDQRFHGYSEYAETHEEVTTSMEWGHVFVDGSADAYYLTGDERSLDAVKMIADRVATIAQGKNKIRDIFAGAERQLGWPLDVLCRSYEVIGDEEHLKAAEKIVEYIKLYAQDPVSAYRDGVWWRSWMMDGCKVFMTGELHDGLAAYYRITHDEELRDVIMKSLDWLIDNMWNPDTDGFMYEFNAMNRPHRIAGMSGLNMLIADAFCFGYEMAGDLRYLSVAARSFWSRIREMDVIDEGKQFTIDTRTSPHAAAYFNRANITLEKLPPSPQPIVQKPAESKKSQPRSGVTLHADFNGDLICQTPDGNVSGIAVGNVEFVPGRKGSAVSVGKGGYVWLPAPPYMLQMPGAIELWASLHFRKNPKIPEQRAVFYIEGENPLIDSLCACTIYNELRIRMKDHVNHLNGTAEGEISHWEPYQWHHIVVTWDDMRVRLYLDGQEQIRPDEGKYAGDGIVNLPTGQQNRINLGWCIGNWYCDCAIDSLTVLST